MPQEGDARPSSFADCTGTMRYSEQAMPPRLVGFQAEGDREVVGTHPQLGWSCDTKVQHFERQFGFGAPCLEGHQVRAEYPESELRALIADHRLQIYCMICDTQRAPTDEELANLQRQLDRM